MSRLTDGLRKRYPDIAGNPESATSGPDPENNDMREATYPAYSAPDSGAGNTGVGSSFTSTKQIPYRGAEPHGVPFTPETHPDPRVSQDPSVAGQIPIPLPVAEGLPDLEPVPVHVVSTEAGPATRKRFVTTTFVLPGTATNPTPMPVRVAGFRPNRTKIKIWVKQIPTVGAGPSRIWISQDESAGGLMGNGIPIDGTDASGPASAFETNTTDDIWVAVDNGGTNGAMVCLLEEFETQIPADHNRQG